MSFPTKDLQLFEEVEDDMRVMLDTFGLNDNLFSKIKGSTFNNVDASFDINNNLLETESELDIQKKQKILFKSVVFCLLGMLFLLTMMYFLFYKRHKSELKIIENRSENMW